MADVTVDSAELRRLLAAAPRLRTTFESGRDAALYSACRSTLPVLLDQLDTYRKALERIAFNAESWHGVESEGTGAQRALTVINDWVRAALESV